MSLFAIPPRFAVFLGSICAIGVIALWPGFDGRVLALLVALLILGTLHGVAVIGSPIITKARCRGPRGTTGVALTFDDGPNPEVTPKVLELLARHGARATFFVIGDYVRRYPKLLRQAHEAGHAIGTHTMTHTRLILLRPPAKLVAEIEGGIRAVADVIGYEPHLYRQPMGIVNRWVHSALQHLRLTLVGWSVVTRDNSLGDALERARARGRALGMRLRDGDIVIMHDGADRDPLSEAVRKRRAGTLALADGLLQVLAERDMKTVTVDEILEVPLERTVNASTTATVEAV